MAFTTYEYQFSANTSEPPTGSQVRLDNADQALATKAWVQYSTTPGFNVSRLLPLVEEGSWLILQDWDDPSRHVRYRITGPPVDKTTYAEFPVAAEVSGVALVAQKLAVTFADVVDGTLPAGGGTGQHLAKASGVDYDAAWVDVGGGAGPSPAAGEPTLEALKAWLGLDPDDTTDDVVLTESLNASLAAQSRVVGYPVDESDNPVWVDDLRVAIFLRATRTAARRNSPEGVIGLTGVAGELVAARLPTADADVLRFEGPWLLMVVA